MSKKIEIRRCIYCREHRIFSRKKVDSQFTTEHVLHRALASFDNNLTLVGAVCKDCNSYFGNTVDRILTRGTYEAVERFRTGLKPLEEFKDFAELNIAFTTKSPKPELDGAPVRLVVDGDSIKFSFKPHVAFEQKHKREWIRFSGSELRKKNLPDSKMLTGRWQILCDSEEEQELIVSLARQAGRDLTPTGTLIPGEIPVYAEYTVDTPVKRALAKIAYNYFAHMMYARQIPEFMFADHLESAREFIRCGKIGEYEIVLPKSEPILGFDTESLRQTNGHLVSVELLSEQGRWQIVGAVSLFNHLDWKVRLATEYSGIHVPISRGHHWNIDEKTCSEMTGLKSNWTLNVWH
ncbi:MAG: hypothetical protein KC777_28530 [Cyanobacteria bacterium HKST-UBA02]|nr:hypothetical protein [Cyanobacteria bacterium HKST-UBA02]